MHGVVATGGLTQIFIDPEQCSDVSLFCGNPIFFCGLRRRCRTQSIFRLAGHPGKLAAFDNLFHYFIMF